MLRVPWPSAPSLHILIFNANVRNETNFIAHLEAADWRCMRALCWARRRRTARRRRRGRRRGWSVPWADRRQSRRTRCRRTRCSTRTRTICRSNRSPCSICGCARASVHKSPSSARSTHDALGAANGNFLAMLLSTLQPLWVLLLLKILMQPCLELCPLLMLQWEWWSLVVVLCLDALKKLFTSHAKIGILARINLHGRGMLPARDGAFISSQSALSQWQLSLCYSISTRASSRRLTDDQWVYVLFAAKYELLLRTTFIFIFKLSVKKTKHTFPRGVNKTK